MIRRASAAAALCLAWCAALDAHRVDEYLQATRVSLAPEIVELEIDLTPGVDVADQVIRWIDTDRDGTFSEPERRRYAADVLAGTGLEIDGRRLSMTLEDSTFPPEDALRDGTAAIRLRTRAAAPGLAIGPHELRVSHRHATEMSAYLVNALAPPAGITITAQRRDAAQREFSLSFAGTSEAPTGRAWTSVAIGMAAIGALVGARLRTRRPARPKP